MQKKVKVFFVSNKPVKEEGEEMQPTFVRQQKTLCAIDQKLETIFSWKETMEARKWLESWGTKKGWTLNEVLAEDLGVEFFFAKYEVILHLA